LQTSKVWGNIFKVLKKQTNKNLPTKKTVAAKAAFENEGEIITFPNERCESLSSPDLPYKKC